MKPSSQLFPKLAPMSRIVSRYYLVPLLLLMAVWSGWFIHQSSFEINDERYFSLFDDAMITMTYAKNLTQGHGLNWAKFGDPVEGFSSPLWTFLMVPFQLLPINWSKVSGFFAVFCAFILLLNVVVLDRILRKRLGIDAVLPRLAATFTLGFLYPLNFWSLVGMECGPQVLLFLLGLDQFLAFSASKKQRDLYRLGVVLAAALLLRMDMVFFVGWTVLFLGPWLWANKRTAIRFLTIVGLPMALYLGFRLLYFHDLFPNTYYLKLYKIPLDIRINRAWFHFSAWAEPLWLIWALLPILMVPLWKNKAMWLSFLLIVTYLAYNLYAGGDAWEESEVGANRFTIVTMPWIIVIFVAGGYKWAMKLSGWISVVLRNLVPTVATLLLFVLVNQLMFVGHFQKYWDRFTVANPPYNTQYQIWNVEKSLRYNRRFGTGDRIATVQAGDVGYFAHAELIDLLGYNDREIARGEPYYDLRVYPLDYYVPGHVKVDYRHAIGELKPDFIVDTWSRWSAETEAEFEAMLVAGHYVREETGGWIREGWVKKEKP
jgi:hypothetical protein